MIDAQLDIVSTTRLTINCSLHEYHWLLAVLQNPIYDDATAEEEIMREKWFTALKKAIDFHIPF
jgi:hypothetical protein